MTFLQRKTSLELKIGTVRRVIRVMKLIDAPTKPHEDHLTKLQLELTEHLRSKPSPAVR